MAISTQSNNFFYIVCIILLLFIFLRIETSEAARFLEHNKENYLLLPSLQWRPVRPPKSNPGTNSRTNITSQVSARNFAGRKEATHPPPPPLSISDDIEHLQQRQKNVTWFSFIRLSLD